MFAANDCSQRMIVRVANNRSRGEQSFAAESRWLKQNLIVGECKFANRWTRSRRTFSELVRGEQLFAAKSCSPIVRRKDGKGRISANCPPVRGELRQSSREFARTPPVFANRSPVFTNRSPEFAEKNSWRTVGEFARSPREFARVRADSARTKVRRLDCRNLFII